ncbi:MAG TPA: PAS domain S-box protein, partial [Crocinitomix sp.]|nr:PAS domain S-box protein [Crocinitomix sp.]
MMSNVATKKVENKIVTKSKVLKSVELFSFLTDYKSTLLNSKTTYLNPSLQLTSRITTKGKIKFCNTDFCKVVNLNSKEVQNKKITSTFHPEMPKVILNYVKASLLKNEDALAIVKHIDSNGEMFWLNSHFSPNTSNKLNIACSIKSNASSKISVEKIEKIYNTIFLLENHVSYDIAN